MIRKRYNQVPHLTQNTIWKVANSQLDITNESQEVSPFPAIINRRAQKHNKHMTEIRGMIHKRNKNILLEGLNLLHSANLTLSSNVDQDK